MSFSTQLQTVYLQNTFISFVCFPQTVQNPVIVILYILFISRLEFFFEVSPLNYLISQFYFWIVAFFRFYDKATSLPPLKLISSDCITIVFSFHFEMLSSLVIPLSIYHLIVFHALCWIRCYLCHFKNKCPFFYAIVHHVSVQTVFLCLNLEKVSIFIKMSVRFKSITTIKSTVYN